MMKTANIIAGALCGASALALSGVAAAQVAPGTTAPQTQGAPASTPTPTTDAPAADNAAQDASQDIIVTAQRRAERVTQVPISITVASQAQLERQQVNSIGDLSRIAPSLEINTGAGTNLGGGGAIRGIGTQTFAAGAQASVGIVVDQVSQGNVNISDLFDVSRVEVLKGPQGTLFGLTTSAGVINITTNAPDPSHPSLRMRTELSDGGTAGSVFGQQVLQTVVNLPTGSNSALRVSAQINDRQGVDVNTYTGSPTSSYRYALRGRFLWQPTDRLTLNLIGDYANAHSDGVDFFTFISNSPSTIIGQTDIATLLRGCGVTVGYGNRGYCTNAGIVRDDRNYGGSLQGDYDLGPVTLTSITSYRESEGNQNLQSIYRADVLGTSITNAPQIEDMHLFTQEVRLSSPSSNRLEFTVGGFYSHSTDVQFPRLSTNVQPGARVGAAPRTILNPRGLINIRDESIAGFGQATFHATDALRIIGGLRFTHASLSFVQADPASGVLTTAGTSVDKVSYRAGVQYDLARNTMVYATVNHGFKEGQITVPSNATTPPQILRPEIPQSYDIGLKSTLFGGLVLDLNAFHTKITDFQGQQSTINPVTGLFNTQQINVPYILSRGAEINAFGRVAEGLSLSTGFIYADATYAPNTIGKDGTNVGGHQVAFSPRYKFTYSGEYEHQLTEQVKGFAAIDAVWKSRINYQQGSDFAETFRPHWIVGGRIGLRDASNRYTAAIFARNLFNVHEPVVLQQPLANAFPAAVGAIYGPISFRQVGLSLDAKF